MKKKTSSLLKKIRKNQDFEILPNGKIHCKLTGHDIKQDEKELAAYLSSKSYKIAKDKVIDTGKYSPFLVDYKKDSKFLFCKLTKKKLLKRVSVVEKHVNGKKFKRLAEEQRKKQENAEKRRENSQGSAENLEEMFD